jgi:hypothetical protein
VITQLQQNNIFTGQQYWHSSTKNTFYTNLHNYKPLQRRDSSERSKRATLKVARKTNKQKKNYQVVEGPRVAELVGRLLIHLVLSLGLKPLFDLNHCVN